MPEASSLFELDAGRLLPGSRGLTKDQAEALELDRHVVVTAGAGSGKTFTLARRCVRILGLFAWERATGAGSSGPEALLVSTFTDKAAAEMRGRIRAALREAVRDLRANQPRLAALVGEALLQRLTRHLRDSLHRFDRARIHTFHGFCGATLREFAPALGLDPGFGLVTGADADALRAQAVVDALDAAAASADPATAFAIAELSYGRLHDCTDRWVDKRAGWGELLAELGLPDDTVLAGWAERFGEVRLDAAERVFEGVRPGLAGLAGLAEGDDPAVVAGAEAALAALGSEAGDAIARAGRLRAAFSALEKASGGLGGTHHSWVGSHKAHGKAKVAELKERWAPVREQLAGFFGEDAACLETLPGPEDRAGLRLLRGVAAIGQDATRRYDAAKANRRALDFTDLLLWTRRLQQEHPAAQERLRRLRHVCVDEFQDTDALQWSIVRDLIGERPGGLFLVGDPKQAIYRFRGGDVTVFEQAKAELDEPVEVVFPDNFRSVPATIGQINELFDWLMVSGPDRPEYEAPFAPLEARRPDGAHGRLEFVTVEGDDQPAAEAAVCARLLHQRLPGLPTHDGLKAAVLLRRRAHLGTFARALRDAGVPHVVARGRGFFTRPEVLDVANLLLALAHDDDSVALIGALRGPLLGLEDAWLLALAELGGGREPLLAGWRRLLRGVELDGVPPEGQAELRRVADRFRRWWRLGRRLPLSALLATILEDCAAEHLFALEDPSGQAAANVAKLRGLAVRFDAEGAEGLADFALYLRDQADAEADEGDADLEAAAPVVLMTVHQSKGLEFPLVVLPDLGSPLVLPDTKPLAVARVARQQLGGLKVGVVRDGFREEVDTLPRRLVAQRNRAEAVAEARRLLYVAFTRAREGVVCVLPPGKVKPQDKASSWADWLRAWAEGGPRCAGFEAREEAGEPLEQGTGAVDVAPLDGAALDRVFAELPHRALRTIAPHELVGSLEEPVGFPHRRPPSADERLGFARGSLVHGCLEDGLLEPGPATDRRVEQTLADLGLLDDAHRSWLRDELAEHLDGYRRAALPWPDAVYREVAFRLPMGDAWLVGAIDLLWRDPARRRWVVLDYKSNHGDVQALAAHYRPQLVAYGWAACRILPEVREHGWTVDGELLFTAAGTRRTVFEDRDARSLAAELASFWPDDASRARGAAQPPAGSRLERGGL